DEGDARAGADVGNDRPAGVEVVQEVGENADVIFAGAERIERAGADGRLVVAVHAFDLDPRADEVVADHAASGPADRRIDRAGTERRAGGGVEHPRPAAFVAGTPSRTKASLTALARRSDSAML